MSEINGSVLHQMGFLRQKDANPSTRGVIAIWNLDGNDRFQVWQRINAEMDFSTLKKYSTFLLYDREKNTSMHLKSRKDLEGWHMGLKTLHPVQLMQDSTRDKTIRELQSSLPWTAHYHRDFRNSPMSHKDFGHALVHVHKAGGKLAAIIDEAEHAGHDFNHAEVGKYVADLVICALRMANTCPGGVIDLQKIVEERIVGKNAALAEVAPTLAAKEKGE